MLSAAGLSNRGRQQAKTRSLKKQEAFVVST